MELILTAGRIPAAEAHALGLVNHVVAADQVMPTARQIAAQINKNAPIAVRESRAIAAAALEITEEEGWKRSMVASGRVFQTEDAREGPLAFAQKRDPEWKGR
jgi:enoyl-CoA hydratase